MATPNVPIHLTTGNLPSFFNHSLTKTFLMTSCTCQHISSLSSPSMGRSFPITDCRHAPERAHLPGLESTMCRKVRQKGNQQHFDQQHLDYHHLGHHAFHHHHDNDMVTMFINISTSTYIETSKAIFHFSERTMAIHSFLCLPWRAWSRKWWKVSFS